MPLKLPNYKTPIIVFLLLIAFPFISYSQTSEVIVSVNWPDWSGENKVEIYNPSGTLLATIVDVDEPYNGSNGSYSETLNLGCLVDLNNYYITMYDSYGDGWNGGTSNVTVTSGGATVLTNNGSSLTTANTGVNVSFNVSGGGAACTPACTPVIVAPTAVSASPTTILEGNSTNLNATSAGNTINWYTVSSGGTSIGSSASGANFSVSPSTTTTYYAESDDGSCPSATRTAVTVTVISYCSANSNNSNSSTHYIRRVQLKDIDNDPSNNGTQITSTGYSDFTSISTNLTQGTNETITITSQRSNTSWGYSYRVWIDFNQDGDFDDSGELVLDDGGTATSYSNLFNIPISASLGSTRMRVSMKYGTPSSSCGTFTNSGEVEDYTVNILPIAVGPEINVQGNSTNIPSGNTAISTTDNTDFGSLEIGAATSHTFTIQNFGTTNVTLDNPSPYIVITGDTSDFTLTANPTSPIAASGSTTFTITFSPITSGTRSATISIANNDITDGEDPYTFNIEGSGIAGPPRYTAYYNNFDAGDDGWSVVTNSNGNWIRTNTFGGTTEMGEGYFWRNSNYNNYNNNTNIVIESPVYDFTGLKNLHFSIDVKYNTQNNRDGMRILYSISGGAYTLLGSSGTGTNWYEDSVSALGSDGWNNDGHSQDPTFNPHSQFGRSSISLADATFSNVNNVRFRVEFSSDGGTTADGVAFDNVLIEADPITALNDATIAPANITSNLRLWLKTNEGIAVSDGANLTNWEDQAFDTALDKEDAYAANYLAPIYRDNGTRNINFNPVADFDHNNTEYMQGKGGYFSQDYFVVFRSDDEVAPETGSFSPGRQIVIGGRFSDDAYHEDPTGLGMGSTSARFTDEILSHNVSSFPLNDPPNDTSYGRAYTTNTVTYRNHPLIVNVKSNASRTATEIYKNGKRVDNTTGIAGNGADLNFNEFNNLQYLIGTGRSGITGRTTSQLNGMLTEVISYTSPNSAINQQKIQSYLGIKYGVTLQDDTSALTDYRLNDVDYIDSQGAVIWDTSANTGYNYDIAGIGRDDASLLNQKQSRSQNDESDLVGPTSGFLTIGLGDISTTNKTNPNTLSNRNFLIWGNNNANLGGTALTVEQI